MKKVILLLLIGFYSNLISAQTELTEKHRIEILEAKVLKLELLIAEIMNGNSQPAINKNINANTPINSNGEILMEEKWNLLRKGMSKSEIEKIMGKPIDTVKEFRNDEIYERFIYNNNSNSNKSTVWLTNGLLKSIKFPSQSDY